MVPCSLGGSALWLPAAVPAGRLCLLLSRAVAAGPQRGPRLRHRACEQLILPTGFPLNALLHARMKVHVAERYQSCTLHAEFCQSGAQTSHEA